MGACKPCGGSGERWYDADRHVCGECRGDGVAIERVPVPSALARAVEAWREVPEDTRRYTLVALLESQRYALTHGWLHESVGLSAAADLLRAAGGTP